MKERMAPTHGSNEEIEGRAYKEYVYSPVATSASTAACDFATPSKQPTDKFPAPEYFVKNSSATPRIEHPATNMAEKGSTLLQYVAAAAANLCTVASGAMLGWTSSILPKLEQSNPVAEDNPLGVPISSDDSSWIGSLVAVGAVVGSFVAGYLAERFGRKKTLLSSIVPFLIGWALIATTSSLGQILAARLVLGFAMAFAFTVVPMYCGEIAETSVRGALGSFLQLFITVGLLYAYAIGPYVSYVVFWITCAILPVVFFVAFMFMPESPYFLLKQGQRNEAVAALATLRGKSASSVQKEADELQAAVDEAVQSNATIADLFTVKANFKALIYTCALVSFQQLTGINVVLFYMGNIFNSAGSELPSEIATIIVAVVQIAASAVTPVVVDRLGRKILLIFSGVGEILTLAALGLYFYLKDAEESDVSAIGWLPVLSLVIFIATYCVGWGPLPWTVMGEMFSGSVKSKASGITVCTCWGLAFLITKFASNLGTSFGQYTLFWMFAICCLLSVLFTIFILPETKGKSLQQIQDELNGVNGSVPEFRGIETIMKS